MGKQRVRQCVYCGETKEVTKDHVIPKSLFTKPYPPNLITVPACNACNNAKSLNDDFLRDMLTTDVYGNQNPIAQEIFKTKVLSSARQGSSVVARTMINQGRPEPFYSRGGIYLGTLPSAPLDEERVKAMFFLIARGLYFDARKQRIPDNYCVEVLRYHPRNFIEVYVEFQSKLNLNGPRLLGDVFGASFVSAEEDPFTTVWLLWFYDIVGVSVSVINPRFDEQGQN